MRPDGSGARRLVAATQRRPWPQWDPAVSADGQVVAFRGYYGDDEGSYALYVVRADGCGLRRVTRSGAGNPSWSPDGRWIAFDTSGAGEIWKVHPDGSGLSRLIGGGEVRASSPVWSPNGARIAFVRSVPSGSQIWVTSANGAHPARLHADRGLYDQGPAWSHDGTRIAFATQLWPRSSIVTMNADGSNTRKLTSRRSTAGNPIWLPGDSGIAFVRVVGNTEALWAMRPNGRALTRVASPRVDQFTWSDATLPQRRC